MPNFTAQIDGPVLVPGTGDTWGDNSIGIQEISTNPLDLGKNAKGQKRSLFFKFDLVRDSAPFDGIPAGSFITTAQLTVVAHVTSTEGTFNADVSLVPKGTDPLRGQWQLEQGSKHTLIDEFIFRMRLEDDISTNLVETTTDPVDLYFRFRSSNVLGPSQLNQSFTVATSGILSTANLFLRRTGTAGGGSEVRVDIYEVTTPEANPTPSGLLATSSGLPFNDVSTAGAETEFTFHGAEKIDLAVGDERVLKLVHTSVNSTSVRIDWAAVQGVASPVGSGLVNGPGYGWDPVNYPWRGQLPFPFDPVTDEVEPRHPPFGAVLSTPLSDFTAGTREDIADIKFLVQEWVNADDYVEGSVSVPSPIGVVVGPGDSASGNIRRVRSIEFAGPGNSTELEIHFRPRQIRVIT